MTSITQTKGGAFMSADALIKTINKRSAEEISDIKKQADEDAQSISFSIISAAQLKCKKILENAESEAAIKTENAVSAANSEIKLNIANKKYILLSELKDEVKKRLSALPDKDWIDYISKLVLDCCDAGEFKIKIPKSDINKYTDPDFYSKNTGSDKGISFIEALSDMLERKHKTACKIYVADDFIPCDGLIICSDAFDIDLTADSVIDCIFEEHTAEIADCLFGMEG